MIVMIEIVFFIFFNRRTGALGSSFVIHCNIGTCELLDVIILAVLVSVS